MTRRVQGRITADADVDRVAVELRLPGSSFRLILGVAGAVSHTLLLGLVLFGVAGTLDWPRAWVFIAVWDISILVGCWVSSSEVLIERMWPLRDLREMERGDLIFVIFFVPAVTAYLVAIPVEVFHLDLAVPPVGIAVLGLVLLVTGCTLVMLAVRQNRFASALVKIQDDRHHEVIDSGVYGLVRHPMYLGASLLAVGIPMWLGSYISMALAMLGIIGLAMRIRVEERVLREGLSGYADYQRRVPHRLVPYIW